MYTILQHATFKKFCIRETSNLSTDADSSTDFCHTPDQTKMKIRSNQKSGEAL